MANFKIGRGMQDGIPETLTDGMLYYCTDTTNLFIDYTDSEGNLVRSQLSANYADKLRYVADGATVEIDPKDIALDSEVLHKNQPEQTNDTIAFIRPDDTIESPKRTYVNPHGVHAISSINITNEGTDSEGWMFKGLAIEKRGIVSRRVSCPKGDYSSGVSINQTIISSDSDDSNIVFGFGGNVALYSGSKEEGSSGTLIYTMKEDNDLELANKQYVDTNIADAVKYSEQTLTEEQQTQARTNIGAISSSDLVQSDWNQNDRTAPDFIKNRTHYTDTFDDSGYSVDFMDGTHSVGDIVLLQAASKKIVKDFYIAGINAPYTSSLALYLKYTVTYSGGTYTVDKECKDTVVSDGSPIIEISEISTGNIKALYYNYQQPYLAWYFISDLTTLSDEDKTNFPKTGVYAQVVNDVQSASSIQICYHLDQFVKLDSKYLNIPTATNDAAGVVKPVSKTDEMTQPVGIDENGALFAKQVQADWSQNDESAADFVKNRTHYEEVVLTELMPETTVTIAEDGGEAVLTIDYQLLGGDTYIVTFNGTNYECVARYHVDSDSVLIGNGTISGFDNEGNGEPFSIRRDGAGGSYIAVSPAGEYTVSISIGTAVIHKIEEKYLPESVLMQADWTQNDSTASDYIKNRPGGYYELQTIGLGAVSVTYTDATDVTVNSGDLNIGYSENTMTIVSSRTGEEYTLQKRMIPEYVVSEYSQEGYGNLSLLGSRFSNTGEKFLIYTAYNTLYILREVDSSLAGQTDELTRIKRTNSPVMISREFLPEICEVDSTLSITGAAADAKVVGDKFDTTQEHLSSLDTTVESVQADLGTAKADISSLKTDVESIQTDIDSVQTDIESIQTNITSLQTGINALNKIVSFDKIILTDIDTGVKYDIQIKNGTLVTSFSDTNLVDFTYTTNDDGTYTLTGWNGTLNGEASTEIVVPDSLMVML